MTHHQPGQVVGGRYQLIEQVGETGTEAVAFLARDTLLDLEVLCRIGISPAPTPSFRAQVRHLRSITCPFLPACFEYVQTDALQMAILEHIQGVPLSSAVPGLSTRQILNAIADLATALGTLHSIGFAHGDVSLQNLILRPTGQAALIDPDPRGFDRVSTASDQALDRGAPRRMLNDAAENAPQDVAKRLLDTATLIAEEGDLFACARRIRAIASGPLGSDAKTLSELAAEAADDLAARDRLFTAQLDARWRTIGALMRQLTEAVVEVKKRRPDVRLFCEGMQLSKVERLERESAGQPRAQLKDWDICICTADADRLSFRSEHTETFRRPWVDRFLPNNLLGELHVQLDVGTARDGGHYRIFSAPERSAGGFIALPDGSDEIDGAWIERSLKRLLLGIK